jgi:hypothetical protein
MPLSPPGSILPERREGENDALDAGAAVRALRRSGISSSWAQAQPPE